MFRFGAVFFLALSSLAAAGTEYSRAAEMYDRAQYKAVVEMLKPYPAEPEALRITGKSFFMLGDFKKAAQYFQKLVRLNPLSSLDFQWLGKAWARQADVDNPISHGKHTRKAQESLEKAVELYPRNLSALVELLDLYLDRAGLDKAQAAAGRISQLDRLEGLRAQDRISLRRQELATPEERFRIAIDQIPQQTGRALDLSR
jgi:tetratricopeptide (TPR) repeat protein